MEKEEEATEERETRTKNANKNTPLQPTGTSLCSVVMYINTDDKMMCF